METNCFLLLLSKGKQPWPSLNRGRELLLGRSGCNGGVSASATDLAALYWAEPHARMKGEWKLKKKTKKEQVRRSWRCVIWIQHLQSTLLLKESLALYSVILFKKERKREEFSHLTSFFSPLQFNNHSILAESHAVVTNSARHLFICL